MASALGGLTSSQNEYIPIANRPETILGSSITAQILAVIAVGFRFYARSKLAHGLGVDDILVVLAGVATTAGTVFVDLQPSAGLGQHQWQSTFPRFEKYLIYTYGAIISYALAACLIKLSILSQYLRLNRRENQTFRWICIVMIGIVGVWGSIFIFSTIFTCKPIENFWKFTNPGKCVLFGSHNDTHKIRTYLAQAISNMILDAIVFLMPIYLLKNISNLPTRSKLGLVGVFCLGGLVVVISVLRLSTIAKHGLGITTVPQDVTWWTPQAIIWTVLEVQVAIICASIPVFWPVLESFALGKIIVVNEVQVTSDLAGSRPSTSMEHYDDEQELTASLNWGKTYNHTKITRLSLPRSGRR